MQRNKKVTANLRGKGPSTDCVAPSLTAPKRRCLSETAPNISYSVPLCHISTAKPLRGRLFVSFRRHLRFAQDSGSSILIGRQKQPPESRPLLRDLPTPSEKYVLHRLKNICFQKWRLSQPFWQRKPLRKTIRLLFEEEGKISLFFLINCRPTLPGGSYS